MTFFKKYTKSRNCCSSCDWSLYNLYLYLVVATVTTLTRFSPPAEETETIVGDSDFTRLMSISDSEVRLISIGLPAAADDAVAARSPPASFALSSALTGAKS